MSIAELILPEFEREMATTRRVLERVPDGNGEWRPHEKSFPIGHLAQHLSRLPGWAVRTLTLPEMDIAPPGGGGFPGYTQEPTAALLAEFDRNVAAAREAIQGTSDEAFHQTWSLKRGGQVMLAMPRYQMFRTMMLNHIVHHRGQLSVYLRLLNVPVPGIYGPSADEPL